MRFNVRLIGKAGVWGIAALVVSSLAFGVLSGIRSRSIVAGMYSTFHWALLAALTFPLLLAPLPIWVIAVCFVVSFEKLERNRAPFLAAIGFVAAMGVIARMAVLEWPTMRTHPLYLLNGYYATEWLAFWFGLVVPRLTTRELGLGAFLPHRREVA